MAEPDVSRYFPPTVQAAGSAPKKRGRKPKVRHDIAEDVPVDGDYRPLDLENEDPAFVYAWMTDKDRGSVGRVRGYVAEKWGPKCCRPRLYFGDETVGSDIKQNELTLMKIPREKHARQTAGETSRHRQVLSGLLGRGATRDGHVTTSAARTKTFTEVRS